MLVLITGLGILGGRRTAKRNIGDVYGELSPHLHISYRACFVNLVFFEPTPSVSGRFLDFLGVKVSIEALTENIKFRFLLRRPTGSKNRTKSSRERFVRSVLHYGSPEPPRKIMKRVDLGSISGFGDF